VVEPVLAGEVVELDDGEAAGADLAPQVVTKLTEVLVAMHDDAEGQQVLKKTDQTTKFDPLPGGEAALRKRLLDSFYAPGRK